MFTHFCHIRSLRHCNTSLVVQFDRKLVFARHNVSVLICFFRKKNGSLRELQNRTHAHATAGHSVLARLLLLLALLLESLLLLALHAVSVERRALLHF